MRLNQLVGHASRLASYALAMLVVSWSFISPRAAQAQVYEIDGLTEPYRVVDVAAPEPGIVTTIAVREGEAVRRGQILATLDSELYSVMVAIAKANAEAQGGLSSAIAELELRKDRLTKLEELRAKDHARQEEVDRARAEVAIAEAKVLAVQEELLVKKLEYEKFKVQLERRTIRSPLDGVVTKTNKDEGEFVGPNDPIVLTVVQLDLLLATFSVTGPQARELQTQQKVPVLFPDLKAPAEGTVEFVSPETDAESGTIRVKVRIDNSGGAYRSGERCSLDLSRVKPLASR